MTVSTDYAPLTFTGNGSTTVFSVTWPFFTGSLIVTSISSLGVETVQTITTNYTVSGGTDANGLPTVGAVTMLTAPAASTTLRIERMTARTQASTWASNDPFPEKAVEAGLDKQTLLAQEALYAAEHPDTVDVSASIGTVTTGAAGSSASVSVAEPTEGNLVFNFTIPRGDTGASGGGSGDMVAAQNLNDLASKKTGLDNISIKATAIPVNASIDLDAATGNFVHVTGNSGNDSFTKILLRMDGADASTTFTDSNAGGSAHTWTANGNAQIDTAQSKFGGASGLFDGTGDYVTTADHADYTLGSGDWTIDCWFRCNAPTGTILRISGQSDAAGTATTRSAEVNRQAAGTMRGGAFVGSTGFLINGTTVFSDTVNTGWHHYAFVRTGNTLKLFIDGIQEGGDLAISGTVNDSTNNYSVGRQGDLVGTEWNGWIDDFRLSVGIARWTANFTPPTVSHGATTEINFMHLAAGRERTVVFDSTPILVNSASFPTPGGNIACTAGDTAILRGDGTGITKVIDYMRADGSPIGPPADGSITTAKIVNDAVTYAKMQNIGAQNRVLGRKTAGAGDTEECTLSEVLDFIGSATKGDLLVRDTAAWASLAAGASGTVLTANGAGALPSYQAPTSIAATQAELEAAVSTTVLTSPGRQQFHPSSSKAWVRFNSAGTVAASYNITSITDSGAGDWTVNIGTDFSSANYCGVAIVGGAGTSSANIGTLPAAGTFRILTSGDPTPDLICATFFGDQA